jgi:flagellar hook-length control protein FliK
MFPSPILSRENRLGAPAPRRSQGAAADFSLPADDGLAKPPRAQGRATRTGDGMRDGPAPKDEARNGRRADDVAGGDRSREARQDARIPRAASSDKRMDRTEEASSRDKAGPCGPGCDAAAGEKPTGETRMSPEEAALLALAAAGKGLTPSAGDAKADADPNEGNGAASADETVGDTIQAASGQGLAPAQVPTALASDGTPQSAAEGEGGETLAIPSPAAGKHTVAHAPAQAGDMTTGKEQDAEKAGAAKAGVDVAKPEMPAHGAAKTEDGASGPVRVAAEPKAESPSPQPALARLEPLPQGLAQLADPARALLSQEADGKPGVGPQHGGARAPEAPPTSLTALPIEIGFRALAGTKRFDIRLDPPELGRVDVSLSFDKDGEVTAKLMVDRVETLHLLQRDARTLERAFDQAGLRTSDAGVQIALSDRNAGDGASHQTAQDRARGPSRRDDAEPAPPPEIEMPAPRRMRLGGVDLNV